MQNNHTEQSSGAPNSVRAQSREIHLKVPDALGDTVISTAVAYALKDALPDSRLVFYSKANALLENIREIDGLRDAQEAEGLEQVISLGGYLDRMPHTTPPYPSLASCMITEAEEKLRGQGADVSLKKTYRPEINLTDNEKNSGWNKTKELRSKYEGGKSIVWISTKTSSANRDWPKEYWKEVFDVAGDKYIFVELLGPGQERIDERAEEGRYSLRETASFIRVANAGITLDTFTLHAAAAAGAQNVITLLGSSNPAVVSYPGFTDLFVKSEKTARCQPCGNHGYFSGNLLKKLERELGVPFHECSRCIFTEGSKDEYACMKQIKPGMVIDALRKLT